MDKRMNRVTDRQRRVAQLVIRDGVPFREAMLAAGYSESSALRRRNLLQKSNGFLLACDEVRATMKKDVTNEIDVRINGYKRRAEVLYEMGCYREYIVLSQHIDKLLGHLEAKPLNTMPAVYFNRDLSGNRLPAAAKFAASSGQDKVGS